MSAEMLLRNIYYLLKPAIPWSARMALRRVRARRLRRRFSNSWPINKVAARAPAGWPGWPDGKEFADVRRAALWARDLLDGELGLTSFVRTSGGRGLHVHVGLNRRADFEEVREFAHGVGEVLARRHPDAITVEQRKDKRGKRIYADVMRNAYAQTVAASYGVRARAGAPVATPLSWAEVEDDGLEPSRFTMATIRARLDGGPDPWADFAKSRHGLGEASKRLARLTD